jgi:hypothetical protein
LIDVSRSPHVCVLFALTQAITLDTVTIVHGLHEFPFHLPGLRVVVALDMDPVRNFPLGRLRQRHRDGPCTLLHEAAVGPGPLLRIALPAPVTGRYLHIGLHRTRCVPWRPVLPKVLRPLRQCVLKLYSVQVACPGERGSVLFESR